MNWKSIRINRKLIQMNWKWLRIN